MERRALAHTEQELLVLILDLMLWSNSSSCSIFQILGEYTLLFPSFRWIPECGRFKQRLEKAKPAWAYPRAGCEDNRGSLGGAKAVYHYHYILGSLREPSDFGYSECSARLPQDSRSSRGNQMTFPAVQAWLGP